MMLTFFHCSLHGIPGLDFPDLKKDTASLSFPCFNVNVKWNSVLGVWEDMTHFFTVTLVSLVFLLIKDLENLDFLKT